MIFALPGAFTPTCSNFQLPAYEEAYDDIRNEMIDEVYCLSVNDTFVMNADFKQLGIEKVKPIPDGNGVSIRWGCQSLKQIVVLDSALGDML